MPSDLWEPLSDIASRASDAAMEEDVYRVTGDGLKAAGLRSTLALFDPIMDRFKVVYASAARPILMAAERLFGARGIGYEVPLKESFTLGQAVLERRAILVETPPPPQAGAPSRSSLFKRGIELLEATPHICAPLIAGDRVLGALVVQRSPLGDADCAPVMALAGTLARSLDRLRRSAEAANRERQLNVIVSINQSVSADLTYVGRDYDQVLKEVKRLVAFDRAELALVEPGTDRVRLSTPGTTLPGELTGSLSYPLTDSLIAWMAARERPYIVPDTNTEREFAEARMAASRQMRSLIALPMRHRGQVLGGFILMHATPYYYGESDFGLLAPIVDQMAGALVNYRLFDQVERARRQMQAVLDSTGDAVIAVDMAGRVSLMNPAAVRLFVRDDRAPLGQLVADAIGQPMLVAAFQQALGGKFDAPFGLEIPLRADCILFADLAPLRDARSAALGWLAVIRDITHFKTMEALRSETVAMAAHDLKSPLHLVAGALGVLVEDAAQLSADQREAVSIAQSGLRRMRALIDSLLDLKRIEDGLIVKRECRLDAVLRSTVEEAAALAHEREQSLSLDVQDLLPTIQADPDRLQQVFANLIGNAIKYTPRGGSITVRARVEDSSIEVAVMDDGPGIGPEDQAHIFERFYRTRSSAGTDGTGMGLAIVKSIVEQHGGQVIVRSALGQGSQFVVTLPAAA